MVRLTDRARDLALSAQLRSHINRCPLDSGHIGPEPLQLIVRPGIRTEYMDHEVAVVHEHPAARVEALDLEGPHAMTLMDGVLDRVHQRLDVTWVASVADHEPSGDGQNGSDIEDHDIGRLRVGGSPGRADDQLARVDTFVGDVAGGHCSNPSSSTASVPTITVTMTTSFGRSTSSALAPPIASAISWARSACSGAWYSTWVPT